MPPADIIKAKLLFVDDDRTFLDFLHQTFLEFSRGQWEMECATDAAAALAYLRHETVDLAVLDLNMPGVNGLQLLRMLKREFPNLQMAFLTGQGDEEARRLSLEEGAAMFLEKPASLAGMESLFATINELARWQQRLGGRGVVRRAGLLDLVRMECKSGNSRLLEVFGAEERGQIWIKAGLIIHALAPEKRGQSAFTHLVCLPNAEVHLKPFVEPIERSVDREWEFLVLEAARVQEQLLQTAAAAPPAEPPPAPAPAKAETPAPLPPRAPEVPPAPSAAPAAPAAPLRMASSPPPPKTSLSPAAPAPVVKEPLPVPPPAPAPAPRVTAPIPEVTITVPSAVPVPEAALLAEPPVARVLKLEPPATGWQVEEMLICSERREVYYEQSCAEIQKRVSLIDFVHQKSRQLGTGLPLGKFDRLELQGAGGRAVIQQRQNRFVFVRTNTVARPLAGETHADKSVLEWLAQQAAARGVLACGVALPDRRVLTHSFQPELALSALNVAWPGVPDTFDAAARLLLPAWQLRWIFERAQIYCTRRPDGASLGLVLERSAHAVDLPAIERFFAEFLTLRAA